MKHEDKVNALWESTRGEPHSRCVTEEEHLKLHRQWVGMCWLCVALLAATATFGVFMLDFRSQLHDQRVQLDQTTDKTLELWRRNERMRTWLMKHAPNKNWPGKED